MCREELKTLSEVQPGKTTSFRQLLSGAFGFSISDDMYQTLTNAIAVSYLKGCSVDREIPRPVDDGSSDESELSADESDSDVSEDSDAAEISADDSEASEVSSSDEDEEEPPPKKKPRATKPAANTNSVASGQGSDSDSEDESDKDSTEEDVLGEASDKGSDNDSHYSGSDNEEMEAEKLVQEVDKVQDDIGNAVNEDVNEDVNKAVQDQAHVPETIAAE